MVIIAMSFDAGNVLIFFGECIASVYVANGMVFVELYEPSTHHVKLE